MIDEGYEGNRATTLACDVLYPEVRNVSDLDIDSDY